MARHLSKHIWPTEYNLPTLDADNNARHDAMDKLILQAGPAKTPGMLKAALPLLQQVALAHKSLDYAKLRSKHCPSTVSRLIGAKVTC